ncbi:MULTISPECIES: YdeI/OmpD-associated family protein [Niastella]|uniref:YdeI/OmpD-associated family protein n=1 Tax=Niastella soli TaxID=2821487 RepID=A0ABS3YM37_9BACT|nr:YdeI/OmpD-associated family protein [Niastella soli]MBO9198898.1 YdeI/OmpD-associated family protein [Niastella soli]
MHKFKATIELIGINPFVFVPNKILKEIFIQAGKETGYIPIKGNLNNKAYKQTLVRYKGAWRLYINTTMLTRSPERIGEKIELSIEFDPADRTIKPHPQLVKALKENAAAKKVFDSLPPSRKKEIVRYIANLKTAASIDRNIKRAIDFLMGSGNFIGREKP